MKNPYDFFEVLMILSEFEKKVNAAFFYVFHNPLYLERRYRQYRILFYTYMFGGINEDDVYFLILRSFEQYHIEKLFEVKHKNRALLRYFTTETSNKYLKKDGDTYALTQNGIEVLWDHLLKRKLFSENERESFLASKRRRIDNLSHGHVTGCSVLILANMLGNDYDLLVEPNICQREYIRSLGGKSVCRPDALLLKDQEEVYIEADRGKETKAQLSLKMERYENHVLFETAGNRTILFTIHTEKMKEYEKTAYEVWEQLRRVNEGYAFICDLKLNDKMNYTEYLQRVKQMKPELLEEFPIAIKSYLHGLKCDATVLDMQRELWTAFEEMVKDSAYGNRRTLIEMVVDEHPEMVKALERGDQFLICPFILSPYTIRRTFIDEIMKDKICYEIKRNAADIEKITYKKKEKFVDEITGVDYIFLHCFICEKANEEKIYICVENIVDDYSAFLRIKRLIFNQKRNYLSDLFVVYFAQNNIDYKAASLLVEKYKKSGGEAKIIITEQKDILGL